MQNLTITAEQSHGKWYTRALEAEIAKYANTDEGRLENLRINHPLIIAHKARMIGYAGEATDYSDWTNFLAEESGPRQRALSLGAGIGRIEKHLIEKGFVKNFEAIDLSPDSNRAAAASEGRIAARDGDLNFVSLPPNSYDFIVCHAILHHLINIEYVLGQVNQALTDDGMALIYEYVGETRWQMGEDRIRMLKELLPEVNVGRGPAPWQVPGFESVRSGELLKIIEGQFGDTIKRCANFGGVYFPFVMCTGTEADRYMARVVEADAAEARQRNVRPCYHIGLYGKSGREPVGVTPWSDAQLKAALHFPMPLGVRLRQMARKVRRLITG